MSSENEAGGSYRFPEDAPGIVWPPLTCEQWGCTRDAEVGCRFGWVCSKHADRPVEPAPSPARLMADGGTSDSVRFESPGEFAGHLYDRAVRPRDTGQIRLRLAVLCTLEALSKWRELHTEIDREEGQHGD